jgi:hypothetical protein
MLLWIAISIVGVAGIIEKNIRFFLDGSREIKDLAENWWLILIVVIAAGLASMIVADLQAKLKPK